MSEETKTPTTVRELGIELQGFKELVAVKFDTMSTEITRLAKTLEEYSSVKADQKELEDLRKDFDSYKEAHAQVHEEQDKRIDKKPILSTVLWALFSSVLTAIVVFETTKLMGGH